MTPSPHIRPARPADRDAWIGLRLALWPDSRREELVRDVDRFFADSDAVPTLAVAFLLVDGDTTRGFAEASLRPYAEGCDGTPVPYLEGWYVDAEWRRRGWGRQLVQAVEAWARERGDTELGSDALLENEVSHAAHGAAGFVEVERIVCYRKSL